MDTGWKLYQYGNRLETLNITTIYYEEKQMKHHIIVKYNDTVTDKEELLQRIKAHFEAVTLIEGISGVEFHTSVMTDRIGMI